MDPFRRGVFAGVFSILLVLFLIKPSLSGFLPLWHQLGAIESIHAGKSASAEYPPPPPNECQKKLMYNGDDSPPLLLRSMQVPLGNEATIAVLLPDSAEGSPVSWASASDNTFYFGLLESMVVKAYEKILVDTDLSPDTSFVVEVGVNQGVLAAIAHHFGAFQVVGFEMQPLCTKLARCVAAVNGASRHVIMNSFVGNGNMKAINVPDIICDGGAGIGFLPQRQNPSTSTSQVFPTNLGEFFLDSSRAQNLGIPQPLNIAILKTDTEGFEPVVLETALAILPSIHNIIVEIFPSNWVRNGIDPLHGFAVLECLVAVGMEAVELLGSRSAEYTGQLESARVFSTWPAFRTFVQAAMEDKSNRETRHPNIWMRWTEDGELQRSNLDVHKEPACLHSVKRGLD
jgi:hypothetical protein